MRNGATVAQKVQTLFIDDIDGSTAEGTVRFGMDGIEYEIDLERRACAAAAGRAGSLHESCAAG
jgi:nucleoid-associated protein Lsr2